MALKTAEQILKEIKNMEVDEYSTPCSLTASLETTYDEIATLMDENGIRHIPVINEGRPVGMVSNRDIKNLPPATPLTAKGLMSDDIYVVPAGTLLRDVVFEMSENKWGSALILGESLEDLMIFTSIDALNALNELLRGETE